MRRDLGITGPFDSWEQQMQRISSRPSRHPSDQLRVFTRGPRFPSPADGQMASFSKHKKDETPIHPETEHPPLSSHSPRRREDDKRLDSGSTGYYTHPTPSPMPKSFSYFLFLFFLASPAGSI